MGFINFTSSKINERNFAALLTGQLTALSISCVSGIYTYFFGSGRMFRFNANNALTTNSAVSGAPHAACEGTGGRVVLFVQNQGFYTSDNNGTSWTLRQAAAATSVSGMASNGNGRIVAQVALSATTWVSNDNGTTWASNSNIINGNNNTAVSQSMRFYPELNAFIRAGLAGFIATSSDGVTWTPITTGAANTIVGQVFFNGRYYFGTTGGQIWSSSDLVSFTNLNPLGMFYNPTSGQSVPQFSILEKLNSTLYAVDSTGNIMYSTDGALFNSVSSLAATTTTCAVNNSSLYFNNGSNILRTLAS